MTQQHLLAPPTRTHERWLAYNSVSEAQGERNEAHAHFKEKLREVVLVSDVVVGRVWQHGRPLLFGRGDPDNALMAELGYT